MIVKSMVMEANIKAKKIFKYRYSWWIVWIGVVHLFVAFAWKMHFIGGRVIGIYWLFVLADKITPWLIGLSLGLSMVLLFVFVVLAILRLGNHEIVGELLLACFICGIIMLPTVVPLFVQHTIHLDSVRIENRTYHLAVYPLFDLNYALYKCDFAGVLCKRVYRSGDIIATGIDASLEYDLEDHKLSIISEETGEIYVYKLP